MRPIRAARRLLAILLACASAISFLLLVLVLGLWIAGERGTFVFTIHSRENFGPVGNPWRRNFISRQFINASGCLAYIWTQETHIRMAGSNAPPWDDDRSVRRSMWDWWALDRPARPRDGQPVFTGPAPSEMLRFACRSLTLEVETNSSEFGLHRETELYLASSHLGLAIPLSILPAVRFTRAVRRRWRKRGAAELAMTPLTAAVFGWAWPRAVTVATLLLLCALTGWFASYFWQAIGKSDGRYAVEPSLGDGHQPARFTRAIALSDGTVHYRWETSVSDVGADPGIWVESSGRFCLEPRTPPTTPVAPVQPSNPFVGSMPPASTLPASPLPRVPGLAWSSALGDNPFEIDMVGGGNPVDPKVTRMSSGVVDCWKIVGVLVVLPAIWLIAAIQRLRRGRWRGPGYCITCGYDLRASEGRCPECGTAIPPGTDARLSAG